jgi:hypothetical protein
MRNQNPRFQTVDNSPKRWRGLDKSSQLLSPNRQSQNSSKFILRYHHQRSTSLGLNATADSINVV